MARINMVFIDPDDEIEIGEDQIIIGKYPESVSLYFYSKILMDAFINKMLSIPAEPIPKVALDPENAAPSVPTPKDETLCDVSAE